MRSETCSSPSGNPRPHPEEPAIAGVSKDEAIEVEIALILYLTRFLHANRYPPRIKCGAGFRLTLWLVARHTILGVTIAVILEYLLDNFGLEFAVGTFGDLGEIEVLDRIAVGVELEAAA